MANFFKEEIEDIGGRLEKAIKQASDELHAQRRLTSCRIPDDRKVVLRTNADA